MVKISQLLDSADVMVAAQQYDKAFTIYNQIIEKKDDCDEAYLMRGELFGKLGQYEKALADVTKAISIDPAYDESYMVLASLYLANDEPAQAISEYKKAASLNNANAVKQIIRLAEKRADQQLVNHRPDEAVRNYKLALSYLPDSIHFLYKYAFAISRTGDFDNAFNIVDKILKNKPDHLPAKSLLVSIYEKTGQRKKGWSLIQSLVKTYPDNANLNITFGKYALQNKKQTEAIDKLIRIESQSELKVDDKLSINMLLGKLYDSIDDFKNAFSHFSKANNLKYNDFDIRIFETQISNIINFYSKERYEALPCSNNGSSDCIFILGMPRSGTSLIEQIVSSHSSVYGGGELQYVPQMAHAIVNSRSGIEFPQVLSALDQADIDGYANDLMSTLMAISPEIPKITDKLPHNFLFIGLIHKLLPNAKIINCLRNPIDNCLSCYFQHFGGYHPYAYNLSDLVKYYHQYLRLMNHWENTLNIPILNVQYEKIVHETKGEVERILKYIELDWQDSCLEFYDQPRTVNTASYEQVNKQIYTGSLDRWKNYKPYIGNIIDSFQKEATR